MKKTINPGRVLINLMLAMFVALFIGVAFSLGSVATLAIMGGIFALGFIPKTSGVVAFAGIQTEVWASDIQENLFANALFLKASKDHSDYVHYKSVHLPQAGAGTGVVVNRSSFPATASERTDTILTYSLDSYSTDPTVIRNVDQAQISYDKRMSVMGDHIGVLSERLGDQGAVNWAPTTAGRLMVTSGADVTTALAPGATGTRKAITIDDIAKLGRIMDADLMPQNGRKLLLQSDIFWQLFAISDILRASYNGFQGQPNVLANGVVARLLGFDIMVRSKVNVFATGANAPKAVGASSATTDVLGSLAWHEAAVARAEGAIQVYSQSGDNGQGDPAHYGVILSSEVLFGSSKLRTDSKGIINLVQGA